MSVRRIGSATRWRFPPPIRMTLDNGLHLELVDMPGQFVAAIVLTIALPTAVEPEPVEGVLAACTAMFAAETTCSRVSGRLGATITTGCDHRGPKIVADCPVGELPALLHVLARMVFDFRPTQPALDDVLRRHRAERVQQLMDPFGLANALLTELVIAAPSRYARPIGGSEESLARIALPDVVDIAAQIDPRLVTVIVVGDLDAGDVSAAAKAFGAAPSSSAPIPGDVPPAPTRAARFACRPGGRVAQTQLILGCFGVDRKDDRWPAARLLAELLGGGAQALLNNELRGRLGISYGLRAKFMPYAVGGLFAISGSVDEARSEEAVDAVLRVIGQLLEEGVPDDLFEQVRAGMVDAAPEIYESALAVAQQYGELISCGLSAAFIDDQLERLRALTVDQVMAVARSLIDPRNLSVVAVGRFDPGRSVVGARTPRGAVWPRAGRRAP